MNTFAMRRATKIILPFSGPNVRHLQVYGICKASGLGIEILTIFNADVVGSQDLLQQLFGIRNHLIVLQNGSGCSRHVFSNNNNN